MRRWKIALAGAVVAAASFNASACYTVYNRAGAVVFQGMEAPVDMSMPLHQALQSRFPGGHMIFDNVTDCPSINLTAAGMPRAMRGQAPLGSPLLTDRATAQRMNLPHTVVAGGVALVPAQQATMSAAVSVIPAASPAPTMLASRAPARAGTVITEMRDPPMTIVQSGDGRVIDATRAMGAGPAPR